VGVVVNWIVDLEVARVVLADFGADASGQEGTHFEVHRAV
jgi:hypothetical protein